MSVIDERYQCVPCGNTHTYCICDDVGSADDAAALLAGIVSAAWLDEQDFPPLAWAVPGVLPEGFTLLVGPPKVGKSWLVANVALAIAAGGRALGALTVDKTPVLVPGPRGRAPTPPGSSAE